MEKQKVAVFVRVSTAGQELENQKTELLEFCKNIGVKLVTIYEEVASGAKKERDVLEEMLGDASKKKFDCLIVWALDRLTRRGMSHVVEILNKLNHYGVQFVSYKEPALRTDNQLIRDILIAVLAALAQAERERISERTKAGMKTARKKGKRIGRPSAKFDLSKYQELKQEGHSAQYIAREFGIKRSTLYKKIKEREIEETSKK